MICPRQGLEVFGPRTQASRSAHRAPMEYADCWLKLAEYPQPAIVKQ